eukprot:m.31500 g.31500  ORF g.31500 m.31500 type:complete len:679 (+) comp4809_c0_seq1:61-2097(+)
MAAVRFIPSASDEDVTMPAPTNAGESDTNGGTAAGVNGSAPSSHLTPSGPQQSKEGPIKRAASAPPASVGSDSQRRGSGKVILPPMPAEAPETASTAPTLTPPSIIVSGAPDADVDVNTGGAGSGSGGAGGGGSKPGSRRPSLKWFNRRSKSADASTEVSDSESSEPWAGRNAAVSWEGKREAPKRGIQRSMEKFRERNMEKFQQTIQTWLPRELEAFRAPPSSTDVVCRVMVIRHGMGKHNDLKGAFSYANRDAELNMVGREQCSMVGNSLRTNGILDELDLAVVSPFRRTIQTANTIFGPEGKRIRTYIQPLCAEHTFNWSKVQQGDRGSTPQELLEQFPDSEFPQYRQFEDITTYCKEHGITKEGAWWHHGGGIRGSTSETHVGFRERTNNFKKWLGAFCVKEGLKKVAVVSHGGFLKTAFGYPKLHNCEIRSFDLTSDGRFLRVAADAGADREIGEDEFRALEVYTVHTSKKDGHKLYQLCGVLFNEPFTRIWRLSDIRTILNDRIKGHLADGKVASAAGDKAAALQNVIQGFPRSSIGAVNKLQSWLWNLSTVLAQPWCPETVKERVRHFFTGTALHRGSDLPGTGVIKWAGAETPLPLSPAESDEDGNDNSAGDLSAGDLNDIEENSAGGDSGEGSEGEIAATAIQNAVSDMAKMAKPTRVAPPSNHNPFFQ